MEAMEFCSRLETTHGASPTPCRGEAQWGIRLLCAGTSTPFAFGETITPELANYDGNVVYTDGPR